MIAILFPLTGEFFVSIFLREQFQCAPSSVSGCHRMDALVDTEAGRSEPFTMCNTGQTAFHRRREVSLIGYPHCRVCSRSTGNNRGLATRGDIPNGNHLEKVPGKALEEMGSGANVRFPPIREGVVATASTPSLSRVLMIVGGTALWWATP